MRKILLFAAACLSLGTARAQQLPAFELRKVKPVICPARPENMFTRQLPPAGFQERARAARRGQAGPANIEVTYTGFTNEAKTAFQYAVDIWKSMLTSPVTIHVDAKWSQLDRNVLGSAGATTVARNFSGAPQANVWYPIALAEKIAGQDLNGATQPEIVANFSNAIPWYYGTDARPPAGRYDLVSVVLHELCHGLGFVAGTGYDVDTRIGDYGFSPGTGPALPYVFATFIETSSGQRIADAGLFTNPSAALGLEFLSNNLYFDSPLAAAVNSTPGPDKRPKLYAPATFSDGSSISHLDEETYPAGTPHSLMTFQIGAAEAIHNPGELTRKMFDEMGWFVTAIRHTPQRDIEAPRAVPITAIVESDGTVTPGSVRLFYAFGSDAFTAVAMTPVAGAAGQYQATIPNPGTNATVRYYLSAADNETSRTYTAPGTQAPGVGTRSVYQYVIGPDLTAPQAAHTPPPYLFDTQLPYPLTVLAADNLGVASVTLEYSVNGQSRPAQQLVRQADGITYRGALSAAVGAIRAGDVIRYSIVVADASARANRLTLGPYTVPVVSLKAAQAQYVNNFNTPTADFVGNGFSVTQPTGFADPAIHSDHPYPDATNLTYQLLTPIVVSGEVGGDTLKFEEIALVEPGEEGSLFGEIDFYDYVVVEGSLDGTNWTPLADGYDARDQPKWLAAYNRALSNNNSTAVGTPALYAKRAISLRNTFAAGAVVQVRFRLFADEAAHGWGWAIDNLSIQRRSAADKLAEGELNVYPNPTTTGQLQVLARLRRLTAGLELRVVDVLGRQVLRQALPGTAAQVDQPLDVSALRPGLYFLRLVAGDETITRKFIVEK